MTPSASGEWTVRRVLAWTTGYLREGGVESARFEAESLLAHALSDDRLRLYLSPDRVLNETERTRYRSLIRLRRKGTPLAYLLEHMPFMDASLRVSPSALIPRPETEEMVDGIIRDVETSATVPERAIDLGTGCGAIAIALANAWPKASIVAIDRSSDALALAQENARNNHVADQISFVCADWGASLEGRFDLMVANPPYVATKAWADLPTDVRDHEPVLALDGGPSGTREVERIITDAPRLLKPNGRLYVEIGADHREPIQELMNVADGFAEWEIRSDRAGRPRVIVAWTPG